MSLTRGYRSRISPSTRSAIGNTICTNLCFIDLERYPLTSLSASVLLNHTSTVALYPRKPLSNHNTKGGITPSLQPPYKHLTYEICACCSCSFLRLRIKKISAPTKSRIPNNVSTIVPMPPVVGSKGFATLVIC